MNKKLLETSFIQYAEQTLDAEAAAEIAASLEDPELAEAFAETERTLELTKLASREHFAAPADFTASVMDALDSEDRPEISSEVLWNFLWSGGPLLPYIPALLLSYQVAKDFATPSSTAMSDGEILQGLPPALHIVIWDLLTGPLGLVLLGSSVAAAIATLYIGRKKTAVFHAVVAVAAAIVQLG